MDTEYSATSTPSFPIADPFKEWTVGGPPDSSTPYNGTVYFVAVFNKEVDPIEAEASRRAFKASIDKNLPFPRNFLVIEGDSLSEQAFSTEYCHWLHSNPRWAGKFMKRNLARFGENRSQILNEFDPEVPAPEAERNYLFLWGGRNDIRVSTAVEI